MKPRDRECAEAWSAGGLAAERALKERWAKEEEDRGCLISIAPTIELFMERDGHAPEARCRDRRHASFC